MTAMMSVPWPLPTDYPLECRYATLLQIRWAGGRGLADGRVALLCCLVWDGQAGARLAGQRFHLPDRHSHPPGCCR